MCRASGLCSGFFAVLAAAHSRFQPEMRFVPSMANFTEELCYYGQGLLSALNARAANLQPTGTADVPIETEASGIAWADIHSSVVDLVMSVTNQPGPSNAALVAVQRLQLLFLQLVQRSRGAIHPAHVTRILQNSSGFVRLRCAVDELLIWVG